MRGLVAGSLSDGSEGGHGPLAVPIQRTAVALLGGPNPSARTAALLLERPARLSVAAAVAPTATNVLPSAAEFLATNPDGMPVTWRPTKTITVAANPMMGYRGFVGDVALVVNEMVATTGLPFRMAGQTALRLEEFVSQRSNPVDVLVAWVEHADQLGADGPAIASAQTWTRTDSDGRRYRYKGVIRLARSAGLKPGFTAGGWGPVLRHEWGHIVGLAHVDERHQDQIMCPGTYHDTVDWSLGDHVGLRMIGRAARSAETERAA